jgi:hypothetical protein
MEGLMRRMENIVIGGIFFSFIICIPATGCFSQNKNITTEEKKAEGDIYTHDFGQVKAGQVLTHNFEFKNETKTVLIVKDVNTSCGCTISDVKKKKLAPGESTEIKVKFNSKGYSDQSHVTQYVYVNTDDIDNPVVRYIIKALVVK